MLVMIYNHVLGLIFSKTFKENLKGSIAIERERRKTLKKLPLSVISHNFEPQATTGIPKVWKICMTSGNMQSQNNKVCLLYARHFLFIFIIISYLKFLDIYEEKSENLPNKSSNTFLQKKIYALELPGPLSGPRDPCGKGVRVWRS